MEYTVTANKEIKMNAIILENEYQIDSNVLALLKSNPTLFTSVKEYICCKNRTLDELKQPILDCDAIVLASTFMYLDQLNEFLDAFLNPNFPPKAIYVNDITGQLNMWKYSDSDLFKEEEIFDKVRKLLAKGFKLYCNYDGMGGLDKGRKVVSEVQYSMINAVFYDDERDEEMCVDMYKKNLY